MLDKVINEMENVLLMARSLDLVDISRIRPRSMESQ